jgi:hypothetical protein
MKQETKEVIKASIFGALAGSILATVYILRTGGF